MCARAYASSLSPLAQPAATKKPGKAWGGGWGLSRCLWGNAFLINPPIRSKNRDQTSDGGRTLTNGFGFRTAPSPAATKSQVLGGGWGCPGCFRGFSVFQINPHPIRSQNIPAPTTVLYRHLSSQWGKVFVRFRSSRLHHLKNIQKRMCFSSPERPVGKDGEAVGAVFLFVGGFSIRFLNLRSNPDHTIKSRALYRRANQFFLL